VIRPPALSRRDLLAGLVFTLSGSGATEREWRCDVAVIGGGTGGCAAAPLSFCPDASVLRQQMAAFLLKTLEGASYEPPDCEGVFDDVPCPSTFADWIEELADRDITGGCGGSNFCPASPNTRGQMAVFLTKTFRLLLYGP